LLTGGDVSAAGTPSLDTLKSSVDEFRVLAVAVGVGVVSASVDWSPGGQARGESSGDVVDWDRGGSARGNNGGGRNTNAQNNRRRALVSDDRAADTARDSDVLDETAWGGCSDSVDSAAARVGSWGRGAGSG